MIKIYNWKTINQKDKNRIMKRSQLKTDDARQVARYWINKIKKQGDQAILQYIRKFDDPNFTLDRLRVYTK